MLLHGSHREICSHSIRRSAYLWNRGMNTRALRALLGLIADADSAGSVEDYRAALLVAIAEVLPCDLLVWNEFPIGGRCEPMGSTQPRDAVSPALQAMFALHMLEHPLIRHYA